MNNNMPSARDMLHEVMSTENIDIKKKNEGKFTAYCKKNGFPGVTDECIEKGLKSKDKHVRKMAIFAKNSKKWHHEKKKENESKKKESK